jgi:hypothetical protein
VRERGAIILPKAITPALPPETVLFSAAEQQVYILI